MPNVSTFPGDHIAQCWTSRAYQKAEHLHRQAIETYPDEQSNYWYLGLALLLQGREEEAQMTWMMPLLDADALQADAWTIELLEVLDREASGYAKEYPEDAWLIRHHIREIAPEQINNNLLLMSLAITLDRFRSQELDDWNIVQTLESSETLVQSEIIEFLLEQVLRDIKIDTHIIKFIIAAASYIKDIGQLVDVLMQTANRVAFSQKMPEIAVSLVTLCLALADENQDIETCSILMQLSAFYQESRQYLEAIKTAKKSYALSKTVAEKIAANHRCLSSHMLTGSNWSEGYLYFEKSQVLLSQLLESPTQDLEQSLLLRLMTSTFFQPYFRDQPQQNRTIQNQVMTFCQTQFQRIHSDRVSRYQQRINPPTAAARLKERPLKIGYLSHCLRRHSVGWISRWIFEYHDSERVKVHTYFVGAESEGTEPMQDWFAEHSDVVHRMPADPVAIADQIYDDAIDILVDLDSITLDATCAVLALKPAPLQVSWLGWDAPGLSTVDYYIVDPYVVTNDADAYYVEKLWRLPQTYVAVDGFEVGVPTVRRDELNIPAQSMVYLSTQRGHKLHPDAVLLQLQILAAVEDSYLLVKQSGNKTEQEKFWLEIADGMGVSGDRLRFLPDVPSELAHRANLRLADVVLDTYPYNGATTTLETLWMELPLVTRVGQQFSSRNSYTMMKNAGIEEGIAWTDKEYVEWGIRLGTDLDLRRHISWKLNQGKSKAPLWNGQQFTKQMEDAYEQMWMEYLDA